MFGVVILYSGRWRSNIHDLVDNHRKYLVDPHNLDVVVVGIKSQICGMQNFKTSVRTTWGIENNRLLVLEHNDQIPSTNPKLSSWKSQMLHNWEIQFSHVRFAFEKALKWKQHKIFIRARIDRMFVSPVQIPIVHHRQVFAVASEIVWNDQGGSKKIKLTHDWFYITNKAGMRVITNTTHKIIDFSKRCFAACPEEQVELHIYRSNYTIVDMNMSFVSVSKKNWCLNKQHE